MANPNLPPQPAESKIKPLDRLGVSLPAGERVLGAVLDLAKSEPVDIVTKRKVSGADPDVAAWDEQKAARDSIIDNLKHALGDKGISVDKAEVDVLIAEAGVALVQGGLDIGKVGDVLDGAIKDFNKRVIAPIQGLHKGKLTESMLLAIPLGDLTPEAIAKELFGESGATSKAQQKIAENVSKFMEKNGSDKTLLSEAINDNKNKQGVVEFGKTKLSIKRALGGFAIAGTAIAGATSWAAGKATGGRIGRSNELEVGGDDLKDAQKRLVGYRKAYAKMQRKTTDPAKLEAASKDYWAQIRKVQEFSVENTDEYKNASDDVKRVMLMSNAVEESHKLASRVNRGVVVKIGQWMNHDNRAIRWGSRILTGAALGAAGAGLSLFVLPASGLGLVAGAALSGGVRAFSNKFARSAGEVEKLRFAGQAAEYAGGDQEFAKDLADAYKNVSFDQLGETLAKDQRENFLNNKRDERIKNLHTARVKAGKAALISVGAGGVGRGLYAIYDNVVNKGKGWDSLKFWERDQSSADGGSSGANAASAEARLQAEADAAKYNKYNADAQAREQAAVQAENKAAKAVEEERVRLAKLTPLGLGGQGDSPRILNVKEGGGGLQLLKDMGVPAEQRGAVWNKATPDLLKLRDAEGQPLFYTKKVNGVVELRIRRAGDMPPEVADILARTHGQLYPPAGLDQPAPADVLNVEPDGGGFQVLGTMGVSPAERLPTWHEATPDLIELNKARGDSLFYLGKDVNGVDELRIRNEGALPPEVKGILSSAHDRLFPIDKLPGSILDQPGGIDAPDVKAILDSIDYSQLGEGESINALARDLGIGKNFVAPWTESIVGAVRDNNPLAIKYFLVAPLEGGGVDVVLRQALGRDDLYELAKSFPRPSGVLEPAR